MLIRGTEDVSMASQMSVKSEFLKHVLRMIWRERSRSSNATAKIDGVLALSNP